MKCSELFQLNSENRNVSKRDELSVENKSPLGISPDGTDGAVNRIKQYRKVLDLIGTGRHFENLEIYAEARYGAFGGEALVKLRSLGDKYDVLVVDAGVVFHIDEFVDFVSHRSLNGLDPFTLRQSFSAQYGKIKLYRGLALTPEEYGSILRNGIQSAYVRKSSSSYQEHIYNLDDFANGHALSGLNDGLSDIFLSLSKHPEISAAVAAEQKRSPNQHIYVFEIEIPKIDVLDAQDNNYMAGAQIRGLDIVVKINGQKQKFGYDANSEKFVLYSISPHEITSSQLFDAPISYKWVDKK